MPIWYGMIGKRRCFVSTIVPNLLHMYDAYGAYFLLAFGIKCKSVLNPFVQGFRMPLSVPSAPSIEESRYHPSRFIAAAGHAPPPFGKVGHNHARDMRLVPDEVL